MGTPSPRDAAGFTSGEPAPGEKPIFDRSQPSENEESEFLAAQPTVSAKPGFDTATSASSPTVGEALGFKFDTPYPGEASVFHASEPSAPEKPGFALSEPSANQQRDFEAARPQTVGEALGFGFSQPAPSYANLGFTSGQPSPSAKPGFSSGVQSPHEKPAMEFGQPPQERDPCRALISARRRSPTRCRTWARWPRVSGGCCHLTRCEPLPTQWQCFLNLDARMDDGFQCVARQERPIVGMGKQSAAQHLRCLLRPMLRGQHHLPVAIPTSTST